MARTREFNKDDVLKKAMNLFWQKGYEATSMADLLEATGLSKSSLYDTFGDKRKLFLSALDAYSRLRHANMLEALDDGRPGRETMVRAFSGFTTKLVEGQRNFGCMSCNEAVEFGPSDEDVQKIVLADFQAMEDAYAEIIARGQRDGSIINRAPAKKLARFITIHQQGLQVMARAGADCDELAESIDSMLSVLDADAKTTAIR